MQGCGIRDSGKRINKVIILAGICFDLDGYADYRALF